MTSGTGGDAELEEYPQARASVTSGTDSSGGPRGVIIPLDAFERAADLRAVSRFSHDVVNQTVDDTAYWSMKHFLTLRMHNEYQILFTPLLGRRCRKRIAAGCGATYGLPRLQI